MASHPSAATVGQLKASGWVSRSVKDEMRANAIAKIKAGELVLMEAFGGGFTWGSVLVRF